MKVKREAKSRESSVHRNGEVKDVKPTLAELRMLSDIVRIVADIELH